MTERHAIDIRVFLATITTAMVLAFGVGVSFGPDAAPRTEKWQDVTTVISEPVSAEKRAEIEEAPFEPSGQHLLIDIKNVESAFLDSEERLSSAMVDAVKAGGLTMLSYHCHKLHPAGVSCVGVLLESHISFHTWPDEGVITLDLFTCGPKPLLPVIPKVEALFAIGEDTVTQWSHELRGFRHDKSSNYLDNVSDLGYWVLSPLEMFHKTQIISKRSKFQQIDIWDVLEVDDTPSHADALKANLQPGDPRWLTPEVALPDRLLFLDGTLQSLTSTEREYHEALVHPVMFAHTGPKHVAMIGGGEGATLREVLKHKTIETATMIEMDQELVEIAREYMPGFSDCSDLEGRADNCFDDEKVTLLYDDAQKHFVERYADKTTSNATKFDVVIVDAFDPEETKDNAASELYDSVTFVNSLVNSLTDDGVLVLQVGTAPNIHDPRADLGIYKSREHLFNILEELDDVKAMLVYEEAHCGFLEPHSFLVVCRSMDCRSRWLAESDAIDYQIYKRILLTKSGDRALVHFDGSTQHSYRFPPKAWETVYCRREPTPFECDYILLDPEKEMHDYVIDKEEDGSFHFVEAADDKDENKMIATVDIPKGSYIMPRHLASSFLIEDTSLNNLRKNAQVTVGEVKVIEDLLAYFDKHGHRSNGLQRTYVEVGASYLLRSSSTTDTANVGRWVPLKERPKYSPVYDRHHLSFDLFLVATKDIKKGQEVVKSANIWTE